MCTFEKFNDKERLDGLKNKEVFEKKIKQLRKKVVSKYEGFGMFLNKIIKMMLDKDAFKRCDFVQLKKRAKEKNMFEEEE